eukprot:gene12742-6934_t
MKRKTNFNEGKKKKQKFSTKKFQGINNVKGILFTCPTIREREARIEATNILEQFINEMEEEEEEEEEVEDTTLESKSLTEEIESLSDGAQMEILETGAKGLFIIRFLSKKISPEIMVKKIMKEVSNENGIKTRYLYKMTPIQTSCHASLENIERCSKDLIGNYFSKYESTQENAVGSMKSWKSMIKVVHNDTIKQKQCIDIIGKSIKGYHFVDLTKPFIVIFIVVFKTMCGIGIIDDYMNNFELNLNKLRESGEVVKKEEKKESNQNEEHKVKKEEENKETKI